MFALRIRTAICGALLFFAVRGEATETKTLDVPGLGKVPYEALFTEISEPGESLDAFAFRVGPRLRAYSDETGFEACGMLTTNGQRFAVVVGSVGSRLACVNGPRLPGDRSTGATIHSHGKQGRFAPNRADLLLSGGYVFTGPRPSLQVVHGQDLAAFSQQDRDGGPGYLAAPGGRLLYQAGGVAREIQPSP